MGTGVAALAGLVAIAVAMPANAAFVVTLTEVGSDVVATGAGSINTTDLSNPYGDGAVGTTPQLSPSYAFLSLGPTSEIYGEIWTGFSGPSAFGTDSSAYASGAGAGDLVGINGYGYTYVITPNDYVSGTNLSATDTFAGQSFASLGMADGSYIWTWGTGAAADSFEIDVGSNAVPEPAALFAVGMLGTFCARRRRRT